MGCWYVYLPGARCRLAYGPADATATHCLCFSKIQIGFTFLVPAHLGIPGKRAVKLVCVYLLSTQVSQYQKGKTNLDFTEARDSEWQWHYLGRMQVCTSLQTDNHASTPPLSFLQAGCPSCRPTNSVKALKVHNQIKKDLLLRL